MFSQKSVLARLLANENISVQQGNFETAFFDVENRVLGLPLWKEMSADVYDLLVGHEVGHALYTPSIEKIKVKGVPFSYVNVIEDIRIEKKVLNKYPGLVNNFKRGYKELVDIDLFGTKDKDVNEMGFMDRLNIKAKGRDLVDIKFSEEEQPYVDMAMDVETFEDVENVCHELVSWLGQKSEDQDQSEENAMTSDQLQDLIDQLKDEDQTPPQSDEGQSDEDENGEESNESSSDSEEGDEEGEESSSDAKATETEDELEDEDGEKSIASKGADNPPSDLPEVETDTAQSNNMSDLVDDSCTFLQGMTRQSFELLKSDYKTVLQSRVAHDIKLDGLGYLFDEPEVSYDSFMAETKQVVNLMAKEFEMRKAAFRSSRARTSTKGSLDVNKLHAYKYDDQLFKQVTTLADGKNHGMIMLVDYSGSMYQRMPAVMRQTMALVMFCKRVNIPFEVYGFTSRRTNTSEIKEKLKAASSNLTRFDYDELQLNQLFSNKMSKSDFDLGMRTFYAQMYKLRYLPAMEDFGSTPLNAALLATQYLIQDFMKSNPVHKLNLVTLTDGESDRVYLKYGVDGTTGVSRDYAMNIKGKKVSLSTGWAEGRNNTAKILNAVTGPNVTTANSAQIARAFKKHSGSKKGNRVVTKKFAELVA